MAMYSISTRPLIDTLSKVIEGKDMMQAWFADDSSATGTLENIKLWWDTLYENGPAYGYHPKPSKTILILKSSASVEKARQIFQNTGINISCEGERHLGAVIGSKTYLEHYVKDKVEGWVEDVTKLSGLAADDPQAAYTVFTKGLSSRWIFLQRTVEGISEYFEPLETAIRNIFIPRIVGRHISDIERRIIALPLRFGGLGIQNPIETADREYQSSLDVTEQLTNLICTQAQTLVDFDRKEVRGKKNQLKIKKEQLFRIEIDDISKEMDDSMKKYFLAAQEKGASAWLSVLPIKSIGYSLNKEEFVDAINLRYGWKVNGTPSNCACGAKNSIDHALSCNLGGYTSLRHNSVRNVEAKIMREVCKDVQIEPNLLPIENTEFDGKRTNVQQNARLDISARGVWNTFEKTFFDVRITHPTAASNIKKDLGRLYSENERDKKALYNERIIEKEKASFNPLVFTTTGGMAPECEKVNKKLAYMISEKRKESYSSVIKHIRTRLRFALLRSTLAAIRGYRGKTSEDEGNDLSEVDFNLIPEINCYEA